MKTTKNETKKTLTLDEVSENETKKNNLEWKSLIWDIKVNKSGSYFVLLLWNAGLEKIEIPELDFPIVSNCYYNNTIPFSSEAYS